MNVTLILIGIDIPSSGLMEEGRRGYGHQLRTSPPDRARRRGLLDTQTRRRFDLVELDRFRYDTRDQIRAFVQHLKGIEGHLRLLNARPGMLSEGRMPEYLYKRTNGVAGLLERLIEDACEEAMASGRELLDEDLFETVAIDLTDDLERAPEAGEVPDVPPHPRSVRRGHRRNSSFDDHGPDNSAATGT